MEVFSSTAVEVKVSRRCNVENRGADNRGQRAWPCFLLEVCEYHGQIEQLAGKRCCRWKSRFCGRCNVDKTGADYREQRILLRFLCFRGGFDGSSQRLAVFG